MYSQIRRSAHRVIAARKMAAGEGAQNLALCNARGTIRRLDQDDLAIATA